MNDIDKMEAGLELDVLIAIEVWGWKWMRWHDLDYKSPDGPGRRTLVRPDSRWLEPPDWVECDLSDPRQQALSPRYHEPRWSTDWAAAGEVAEMFRPYICLDACGRNLPECGPEWLCEIWTGSGSSPEGSEKAYALTAPLAICRAALKAVREKKGIDLLGSPQD